MSNVHIHNAVLALEEAVERHFCTPTVVNGTRFYVYFYLDTLWLELELLCKVCVIKCNKHNSLLVCDEIQYMYTDTDESEYRVLLRKIPLCIHDI